MALFSESSKGSIYAIPDPNKNLEPVLRTITKQAEAMLKLTEFAMALSDQVIAACNELKALRSAIADANTKADADAKTIADLTTHLGTAQAGDLTPEAVAAVNEVEPVTPTPAS